MGILYLYVWWCTRTIYLVHIPFMNIHVRMHYSAHVGQFVFKVVNFRVHASEYLNWQYNGQCESPVSIRERFGKLFVFVTMWFEAWYGNELYRYERGLNITELLQLADDSWSWPSVQYCHLKGIPCRASGVLRNFYYGEKLPKCFLVRWSSSTLLPGSDGEGRRRVGGGVRRRYLTIICLGEVKWHVRCT